MHKKIIHSAKQTSGAQLDRMRTEMLVWLLWFGSGGGGSDGRKTGERATEGARKGKFLLIIHELT